MKPRSDAVVALGSSLGPSAALLRLAVAALAATPGVYRVSPSRVFRTPPDGGVASRPFLNAAVLLSTDLEPLALLDRCRAIERRLGRRVTRRWADRRIDLDILIFDDLVLESTDLTLPHPRMAGRPFQLLPLLDCWPGAPARWAGLAQDMRALPIVGVLPRSTPRRTGPCANA